MVFSPCRGRTACRDDGIRCLTCGRSLEEMVRLRELLEQLSEMAITYDYDNLDQFTAYIAHKLSKLVKHRLKERQEAPNAD